MKLIIYVAVFCLFSSCDYRKTPDPNSKAQHNSSAECSIVILGTAQDAGAPHIACKKDCCQDLFKNNNHNYNVVSLGLIDTDNKKNYLFEATPDIAGQLKSLKKHNSNTDSETPDGIFLTHAHIGHYTGLMYLGKEAMNANNIQVYAMPKMKEFLMNNGPWNQLVDQKNITIKDISDQQPVKLSGNLKVVPLKVPHRDEYSETVGYKIIGPNKSALFIPDIDKWEKWDLNIQEEIDSVAYAFIDATFYSGEEINTRDITEIPHPFVIESMDIFKDASLNLKNKIVFIHFNHTNPLLKPNSPESKKVLESGFRIARKDDVYPL